MGLFDTNREPVFLKESSNLEIQLDKLRALEPKLCPVGKKKIKQEIRQLEYGLSGEKNIAFELKNCHMLMYVLHDIYLEDEGLSAQIDYLIFTKKLIFVIECKNLYGDIEVNSNGDFIRTTDFSGFKKREGIYSPITQNQRHLELIKKIKIDNRSNLFTKHMTGKYFENFYKPIVVLANPKTILNTKKANNDVINKVIRTDQLVAFIKDAYKQCEEFEDSNDRLHARAQSFLELHCEQNKDYTTKYEQYIIVDNKADKTEVEKMNIFKELKDYRLEKSREEKIKPYFIYNNSQMEDLISKMPKTIEDLLTVSGFGEVKSKKYGDEIIRIIKKYL